MPNVFDRLGLAWDPRSPRFAMHLESSISGEALTDYTVRNMGYVAVAAFNASAHVPTARMRTVSDIIIILQRRRLAHRRRSNAPHTASAALTTSAAHDTDIATPKSPSCTCQPCTILTTCPSATSAKIIDEIAM